MVDRIVVTGMGTVSPLGLSVTESWNNALAGVSGVGPITLFDASNLGVQIASEVPNFNPQNFMDAREARRRDRYEQFAIAAAKQAHEQAGLNPDRMDVGRVGVLIASAIGGLKTTSDNILDLHDKGPNRVSPFTIPMLMINGAAGMVSIEYGYQGPSLSVVSACASGLDAIGTGWMMLPRRGYRCGYCRRGRSYNHRYCCGCIRSHRGLVTSGS